MIIEAKITAAEVNAELRAAFAELPAAAINANQRSPRSYAEISAALAIPHRKH